MVFKMIDLKEKIKPYMSEKRYDHTLSVAEECARLAEMFKVDRDILTAAGYLHDITKEMPVGEQILLCNDNGVILDDATLASPKIIHSFSAPIIIQKDFAEYAKEDTLTAVRYHTTGRENMSIYEKLVYLADYIEPTRKHEECIELRKFFYEPSDDLHKKLDDTIFLSLKYTITDLLNRGKYIHPLTVKAYNYLLTNKTR